MAKINKYNDVANITRVAQDVEYLIMNGADDSAVEQFLKDEKYDPKTFKQLVELTDYSQNPVKKELENIYNVDDVLKQYKLPNNPAIRSIADFALQATSTGMNQYLLGLPGEALKTQGAQLAQPSTTAGQVGEIVGGIAGTVAGLPQKIALTPVKGVKMFGQEIVKGITKETPLLGKVARGAIGGAAEGLLQTPRSMPGEQPDLLNPKARLTQAGVGAVIGGAAAAPISAAGRKISQLKKDYDIVKKLPRMQNEPLSNIDLDTQIRNIDTELTSVKNTLQTNIKQHEMELAQAATQDAPIAKESLNKFFKSGYDNYKNTLENIITVKQSSVSPITNKDVLGMYNDLIQKVYKKGLQDTTMKSQNKLVRFIKSIPLDDKPADLIRIQNQVSDLAEAYKSSMGKIVTSDADRQFGKVAVNVWEKILNKVEGIDELRRSYGPFKELEKAAARIFGHKEGIYATDRATNILKEIGNRPMGSVKVNAGDQKFLGDLSKGLKLTGGKGPNELNELLPKYYKKNLEFRSDEAKLIRNQNIAESKLQKLGEQKFYQKQKEQWANELRKATGLNILLNTAAGAAYYIVGKNLVKKLSR